MKELNEVRIDKWLWAIRIFKTRRLAADACNKGKVKIENKTVKPARTVRGGETIEVRFPLFYKTIRVEKLLDKRVGAAKVSWYLTDLTPPAEYENAKLVQESKFYRPKGLGRPTKKERRLMDKVKNTDE